MPYNYVIWSHLFEVTPLLLYEMVSLVRSGLCSKWSLYEVTWHRLKDWADNICTKTWRLMTFNHMTWKSIWSNCLLAKGLKDWADNICTKTCKLMNFNYMTWKSIRSNYLLCVTTIPSLILKQRGKKKLSEKHFFIDRTDQNLKTEQHMQSNSPPGFFFKRVHGNKNHIYLSWGEIPKTCKI